MTTIVAMTMLMNRSVLLMELSDCMAYRALAASFVVFLGQTPRLRM